MRALSKTYVFALATALVVLVVLRPPLSPSGSAAVVVTFVSLLGMGARATGVRWGRGWPWWAWLGLQVMLDAVAFTAETDAIWEMVGSGWGWLAALGSGLVMLPLYWALFQLGRGKP